MPSASAILNELEEMEQTLKRYSSTNEFRYGYDEDNTGEIFIVYDGDGFPQEIEGLLTRDDSTVSSFYSDAPLTIKITVTPRRLPNHD